MNCRLWKPMCFLVVAFAVCSSNFASGEESSESRESSAKLDIGLTALSAAAEQVPYHTQHSVVYDPAVPAQAGILALYLVNHGERPLTIDTSAVSIYATGCESFPQRLSGDIFQQRHFVLPAGETKIILRIPWVKLLDAEELKRAQKADEERIGLGFGGAPDSQERTRSALSWTWDAILVGPPSPIYDRRGKLACAATLWAELRQNSQIVRSRPLMVTVAPKTQP